MKKKLKKNEKKKKKILKSIDKLKNKISTKQKKLSKIDLKIASIEKKIAEKRLGRCSAAGLSGRCRRFTGRPVPNRRVPDRLRHIQ